MITYKTGNIILTPDRVIAHSTNCQGVMGSGVAKALRDRWPNIFSPYRAKYDSIGLKLGEIIPVDVGDKVLINMMTQEFYGNDGKRYCDYDAIRKCLIEVREYLKSKNINSISMPMISAGLAGGDWSIIKQIIDDEMANINVTIWSI